MKKLSEILSKPYTKFLLWFLTGVILVLIGIMRPKADTIGYSDFTAQLYDNARGSLSAVTTNYTNASWRGTIPYMVANSSGAAWGISSGKPLLANHTYSFSIQITGPYGGRIILSTYNRIGVGSSLANAKTSYENNSYVTENYSNAISDNGVLQFAFTPTINGSYIVFPFSVNSTGDYQEYWISSFIIEDLGAGGVSETTINNSLNSQTNVLNRSITNSQNAIIQNQNENNQALIDSNKELLGNCHKNLISSSPISLSGRNYNYSISLESGKTYNISTNGNIAICIHSGNFNCINELLFNSYSGGSYANNYNITGTSNSLYLSASFGTGWGNFDITGSETMLSLGNSRTSFVPYGTEKCTSKLDDTNQAINDVNNSLNDDDTTGATDKASDFFSSFSTNTFGLTSIITAPLNLIQSLTSSTCTALHIPLPYLDNKYIDLPCMTSIYQSTFGAFFTMYQTVTFGIIAYWVCVRIFNQVKDFKNPEHDEIEVLDL